MREIESSPSPNSTNGGRTNFPIVPLKEVPALGLQVDTSAYRPMVLVVDDEASTADSFVEMLNQSGYAAIAVYDGESALENALLMPPELVVADVDLPGMSGIELGLALRSRFPDCRILLFSGHASTSGLLEPVKRMGHTFEVLGKPAHPSDLVARVKECFQRQTAIPAQSD